MGTKRRQPKPMPGLADTLFSATQQRVLGRLFGQPERSFYANELIAASGGGSGAVQRELARLEAAGLIGSTRIGNQKHYQANRQSPIFDELRGIVRKIATQEDGLRVAERSAAYRVKPGRKPSLPQILRRLGVTRARLAAFCREHGIRKLSFFGSVTRSDFRPDSDVDVMLEYEPGRTPSLFDLVDLKDELSRLFHGRRVDVASPRILENPYRRKTIERDIQAAYGR